MLYCIQKRALCEEKAHLYIETLQTPAVTIVCELVHENCYRD